MKLWAASAISDVGSQVTVVALPLIAALSLGATPWQMGLLSAAGSAPILLVGLFAGVWVDRLRRRPLMIAADVGRAALLLLIPLAAAAGTLRTEILYVVALSTGALSVLFDVAYLSLLPTLVDRDELVEANGKLEVTASVAQVVGSEFTQWMAIVVYYVSAVSVRQALVPDRLRGRVNATMRFLAGGAMPIGALIGGALGGVIGLPWTLVAAELGMLLGFVWLVLSPVRALRELPAGEGSAHGG